MGSETSEDKVKQLEKDVARLKAELSKEKHAHLKTKKRLAAEQRRHAETRGRQGSDLAEIEKQKDTANSDPLTRLANRRAFEIALPYKVLEAQYNNNLIVILNLDIDHFKRINDTDGHGGGDKVLINFADTLRNNTRSKDLTARVGGEEFYVVMEIQSRNYMHTLREVTGNLCRAVSDNCHAGSDRDRKVTVSIGAAIHDPKSEIEKTIKRSDEAMYHSKKTGRNRASLFVFDHTSKIESFLPLYQGFAIAEAGHAEAKSVDLKEKAADIKAGPDMSARRPKRSYAKLKVHKP